MAIFRRLSGDSTPGQRSLALCGDVVWVRCQLDDAGGHPVASEVTAAAASAAAASGRPKDAISRALRGVRHGYAHQSGVIVFVPENMDRLDHCQWNGDAMFDMSKYNVHGPPTLGQIVEFLRMVDDATSGSKLVVHVSSPGGPGCATGAVLAGALLIWREGWLADDAWRKILSASPAPARDPAKAWDRFSRPFSSSGRTTATSLSVLDCMHGLQAAINYGWVENYRTFDMQAWSTLRRRLDSTWLVPGEILALGNPSDTLRSVKAIDLFSQSVSPDEAETPTTASTRGLSRKHSTCEDETDSHGVGAGTVSFQLVSVAEPLHGERKVSDESEMMGMTSSKFTKVGFTNLAIEEVDDCPTQGSPTSPFSSCSVASMGLHKFGLLQQDEQDQLEDDNESMQWDGACEGERAGVRSILVAGSGATSPKHTRPVPVANLHREPSLSDPPLTLHPGDTDEEPTSPCLQTPQRPLLSMQNLSFASFFRSASIRLAVQLHYDSECQSNEHMEIFGREGIRIEKLEFVDGTAPPDKTVETFIQICRSHRERGRPIAVYCKAGLGRTASLIGAYAARVHGVNGRAFHGWARISRPGSVQTPEQERWLRKLKP